MEPWLQERNAPEPVREFAAKLDVTPESNGTSASEVASTKRSTIAVERGDVDRRLGVIVY